MDGCWLDQGGEIDRSPHLPLAYVDGFTSCAGYTQHRQYSFGEGQFPHYVPTSFFHLQCGPGPTEEACRLDGGEQYTDCPEYEASCDEMQAEYQWVDRMSLEDSIP